jgi:hypothetical protein
MITSWLAACGGGGGGAAPAPTPPPAVVANPPVIAAQPAAASAITGASVTFSVSATGPELRYQWQRDGVAIAGATASTYTTGALTASDHGTAYSVLVSNTDGIVASAPAALSLVLSSDQQRFESLLLAPGKGSVALRWNLNLVGPQVSGTNHLYAETGTLSASPLTLGGQRISLSAPHNLTATLTLPAPEPTRVLKGGAILVVPGQSAGSVARYVGPAVQIETLAQDNTTVAYAQRRSDFTVTPLSGLLANSPTEFAYWLNSLFANPATLKTGSSHGSGAAYVRYTAHNVGDRYNVFDCAAATVGAAVSPCLTNTSLTDALNAGIPSGADGLTYRLADGVLSTVGGVPMWVASVARPLSSTLTLTQQYRVYFALNGNVYTGALIKDGTLLGGSYHVSNPTGATVLDRLSFLPYQIRMNQAAQDGLAAAVTF